MSEQFAEEKEGAAFSLDKIQRGLSEFGNEPEGTDDTRRNTS
jgi:hypothetical protein